MSLTFDSAIAIWRGLRAEFELYREVQHAAASDACNTVLLNRDALARGIDSYSLFIGPRARAERWASDELLEWWQSHGRMTFADYEAQRLEEIQAPY